MVCSVLVNNLGLCLAGASHLTPIQGHMTSYMRQVSFLLRKRGIISLDLLIAPFTEFKLYAGSDVEHINPIFSELKRLLYMAEYRCNITSIMLEMDRMLRPGGRVYIRDSVSVISELKEIASAIGWVTALHDTGEGPFSSWKILVSDKRL